MINDGESKDSGSDFRRRHFLPLRQDTKIVGIFTSWEKAVRAAEDHVLMEDLFEPRDYVDGEEEDDETWREELEDVDWSDDGYFKNDETFDWKPDHHVYISKTKLDSS